MAGRGAMEEGVVVVEKEGPMVPVFTVIKNGAILKNIFVINNGAALHLLEEEGEEVRPFDRVFDLEGRDEVLIVGRHPDCDIVLTHPSVSRFHLKILSNPTARKLSVMDLSSVHGTWISDSRIDPGILVELNEGNTIRVGGSSRVYRLHWVPLSRAYDCGNPFISDLDLADFREAEEENEVAKDAVLIETHQDDYDGEVVIVEAAETKKAYALVEDKGISQNEDLSAAEGTANNSGDLTLEDSIASLALHKFVKAKDSSEFLNPVKGNLLDGLFKEDAETSPDNPGHSSSLFHLEAPSSTHSQMCGEEQSKQGDLDLENLMGSSEALARDEEENAFSGNQWMSSKSRLSSSLGASPCSLSPATPPKTGNPLSDKHVGVMPLTCVVAETAKFEESIRQFSPSLEAHLLSPVTPMEIGNPHSGKWEIMPLSPMVSDPLLQKESCNHSTKWTSHPTLSQPRVRETENISSAAVKFTIVGAQNCSGHQKGILRNHSGGHSRTSKKNSAGDNSILAEVTHRHYNEENENPVSSSVNRSLFSYSEKETSNLKSSAPKSNIWSRRGKPASVLQLQTGKARSKAKSDVLDQHKNANQHQDKKENKTITWGCSANSCEEEEEIFTPDKENMTPNTRLLRSLHNFGKKESGDEEGGEVIFTPGKENMTPNTLLLRLLHKFGKKESGEEDGGEEIFTPDKENITPDTRLLRSLNKISKIKGGVVIHSNSIKMRSPSKLSCLGNTATSSNMLSSEKERKTPELLRKQVTQELQLASHPLLEITRTQKKSPRAPFQSLQWNQDNVGLSMNWTMVVDISSFLFNESWKSLQLLRGLKGTQLMIPRMVMRELECLKQRSGLFERATYISSLLEWIEVCMVTTPWWIHIQTKQEEEKAIAPTPPSSPCSAKISFWGNQCEVNSPTEEDCILEYAISLSRTQVDRRIVLISDDVTMKIKAMAEGMICETAHEFRTSLVNPFSDRFMWRNSTARGHTWSGANDDVLREIVYHQRPSMKKQSRGERTRGLQLILLHNSQYGKQSSN